MEDSNPNMGEKFTKTKKFLRECIACKCSFYSADVKTSWCDSCKNLPPNLCGCGCGKLTSSGSRLYLPGHSSRVSTKAVLEGREAQRKAISGINNPSKREEVKKKISDAIKGRWCAAEGKTEEEIEALRNRSRAQSLKNRKRRSGFRSSLEESVASAFSMYKIPFLYEQTFKFPEGDRFYPDFYIWCGLVEVTGFAYPAWQSQFIHKAKRILALRYTLFCITYQDKVELLKSSLPEVPCFHSGELDAFCDSLIHFRRRSSSVEA